MTDDKRAKEEALLDAVEASRASREIGREQGKRGVWMRLLSEAVDGVIDAADIDTLRVLRVCLKQHIERVDVLLERAAKDEGQVPRR